MRPHLLLTLLTLLTLGACASDASDATLGAADAPPDALAPAEPAPARDDQEQAPLLTPLPVQVDTSSYTHTRLSLHQNALPSPEAVSVGDFLHFFPQRATADAALVTGPLLLSLEAAPSPLDAGRALLRVDLEAAPAAPRAPVHLVFLVDVSGSMQSAHKVGLVKHALKALVDGLGPQDTLALVYEGQGAQLALPPTSPARRGALLEAIEALSSPPAALPAGDGLALAYEVAGGVTAQGQRRVVWCSDGDFWRSDRDPAALSAAWARRGVGLHVLGYGEDIRDPFLESLPQGEAALIQSRREALRALSSPALGGLPLRAMDVELEVALDPAQVHSYRIIGYEASPSPAAQARPEDLGDRDLSAGRVVTAYLELTLTGAPAEAPLAQALARYRAPDLSADHELSASLPAALPGGKPSARFRLGAALVGFGERLRRSPWSAASLPQARALAQDALGDDPDEDQIELLDLMDRADLLLSQD